MFQRICRDKAVIDTFLLSCRVLGRGVEHAFLAQLLTLVKNRGCKFAVGKYCATRRNRQVEFFYVEQGFQETEVQDAIADHVLVYNLENTIKPEPDYFKIVSEIE